MVERLKFTGKIEKGLDGSGRATLKSEPSQANQASLSMNASFSFKYSSPHDRLSAYIRTLNKHKQLAEKIKKARKESAKEKYQKQHDKIVSDSHNIATPHYFISLQGLQQILDSAHFVFNTEAVRKLNNNAQNESANTASSGAENNQGPAGGAPNQAKGPNVSAPSQAPESANGKDNIDKHKEKLDNDKKKLEQIKNQIPSGAQEGYFQESLSYFTAATRWKDKLSEIQEVRNKARAIIAIYEGSDKDKIKELLKTAKKLEKEAQDLIELPRRFLDKQIDYINKFRSYIVKLDAYAKNISPLTEDDILDLFEKNILPNLEKFIAHISKGATYDEERLVWKKIKEMFAEYKSNQKFDRKALQNIVALTQFLLIRLANESLVKVHEAIENFVFEHDLDPNAKNKISLQKDRNELSAAYKAAIEVKHPGRVLMRKVKYFDPSLYFNRKVKRTTKTILRNLEGTGTSTRKHAIIKGDKVYELFIQKNKENNTKYNKYAKRYMN